MVKTLEDSDLLSVERGIICHQTNCIGVMGAGLALQLSSKWPKVYSAYLVDCKLFEDKPSALLGHVQDILVADNLVVVNCFGQVGVGKGLQTRYEAWDTILSKLKDIRNYFGLPLHFPYGIGCGLAGGDWSIMQNKIYRAFLDDASTVFIHKLARS